MGEAGASDEEIRHAISDATMVRETAQKIIENHGLKKLGITCSSDQFDRPETVKKRISCLVSIAAAYAVNCTTCLEINVAKSKKLGITDDERASVFEAALFIKGEAAHYVNQIAQLKKEYDELQQLHDELKETQAQLVQSEKMASLGKLVSGVVHEMNTPIGALRSANDIARRSVDNILEMLNSILSKDDINSNTKLQNNLKVLRDNNPVIKTAIDRITKIVGSLKSFSRLDQSLFQKMDLHEGLESSLTLLEHELGDRITVEKEFGEIPKIACYPGEINQVFMNLLTNAIQAIEGKGIIKICTFMQRNHVCIQILDTGNGITQENINTLFEPRFTKKDSRIKAGLGLFTSYNIVQKHQGKIEVESEKNKGSTFTVVLPVDLDTKSGKK